ncbi:LacI family DNA-binding transcriptional regulator [Pusillimonas sp. ANT_WB101]|uniref:LacI family DNA-binding transcriptional regulator n=1 Tax=Pusillimonas sp. ANT_WB101 TaxID=2597356 RepID=UPI00165D8ED7|nr:LacI family DNA-binding transcriptional regulator [Pusillimonas sp. ANT_WB101]
MTRSNSLRASRRKAGAYTIHDVAALAGVSAITVSRYFNAPEKVSEGLRVKLREIIDRIGYVPSQVAGGLASGHGRVVCAVMQNIASSTFAGLVKGMTDELRASGLQLLLANAQYSRELEEQAIRTFVGWHPTALILTRDDHTPAAEAMLRGLNVPIVEAWGVAEGRPFHQVGFPNVETGGTLAEHFLEQGATRIQFVMPSNPEDFRAEQRARGFAEHMKRAGFTPHIQVAQHDDEFDAGAFCIASLAAQAKSTRAQALIFASDNMAAGAILHAEECGLSLPRDCAIAGFGDAAFAARLKPALTTLRPARYEIGQQAARTVLALLAADPAAKVEMIQELLPCELLVRESSLVHL